MMDSCISTSSLTESLWSGLVERLLDLRRLDFLVVFLTLWEMVSPGLRVLLLGLEPV